MNNVSDGSVSNNAGLPPNVPDVNPEEQFKAGQRRARRKFILKMGGAAVVAGVLFGVVVAVSFAEVREAIKSSFNTVVEKTEKVADLAGTNKKDDRPGNDSNAPKGMDYAVDSGQETEEPAQVEDETAGPVSIFPGPLVRDGGGDGINGLLSSGGVIAETNKLRTENGVAVLNENAALGNAAENKLKDMIEKGYFDHISPLGESPEKFLLVAGYEYALMGENLAAGLFESDAALVKAWYDSPKHKKLLLDARQKDIGVSVQKGVIDGKTVWIVVQMMGLPLGGCVAPDKSEHQLLEQEKARYTAVGKDLQAECDDLDAELEELDAMAAKISGMTEQESVQLRVQYEARRAVYDERRAKYKKDYAENQKKYNELQVKIDQYNEVVRLHNDCLDSLR